MSWVSRNLSKLGIGDWNKENSGVIGTEITGRAVTATLYVSPNGDDSDGSSWIHAYTTIQGALAVASTDINECTLINIGINTGSNNYDINTTGDPTYTGNYILQGTHRTWAKIENTHASATSILKFTGYVSLYNLNFNLGNASVNGVIITNGAFRIRRCQFVGESLGGAATALHIDGATTLKHGIIEDCEFKGHVTYMTGLLLDNTAYNNIHYNDIHKCLTAIQIVNANSDSNSFSYLDIGDNALGIDLDAGNGQYFKNITFHDNTTNIDDEVGDHKWNNVKGAFPIGLEPDNFTGVTVATGDGADTWTAAPVEVRAAVTSTKPFRIIGVSAEADASEKFRLRLSADNGSTWFKDFQFEGDLNVNKRESFSFPEGTEFIFNKGTQITAESKSESAGVDNTTIWLEIQNI